MGKKAVQATMEKKKFNSLIKVLKPKVYITGSASFKGLVQQLTGNGSITSTVSSLEVEVVNRVVQQPAVTPVVDIIDIDDDDQDEILAGEKDNLFLDDDDALALDCFRSWNGQAPSSFGVDESRVQAVLEEISACVGDGNDALQHWKMQGSDQLQQLGAGGCFMNQTLPCFDGRHPEMAAWEEDQRYHLDLDMEWLAFQEVESWLLDSDQQQPFPPCGGQMMQQQIHPHNYNNLSTNRLQ